MAYKMTHPDSELEIEVEANQVPMYVAQGWQTKPGVKAPEVEDPGPQVTVLPDAIATEKDQ